MQPRAAQVPRKWFGESSDVTARHSPLRDSSESIHLRYSTRLRPGKRRCTEGCIKARLRASWILNFHLISNPKFQHYISPFAIHPLYIGLHLAISNLISVILATDRINQNDQPNSDLAPNGGQHFAQARPSAGASSKPHSHHFTRYPAQGFPNLCQQCCQLNPSPRPREQSNLDSRSECTCRQAFDRPRYYFDYRSPQRQRSSRLGRPIGSSRNAASILARLRSLDLESSASRSASRFSALQLCIFLLHRLDCNSAFSHALPRPHFQHR